MERIFEEEERRDQGAGQDRGSIAYIAEAIHALCKYNARAPLDTDKQLELYLRSWWSKLYNRPLKDPLLLSYTVEELLYEFYDRAERNKAENEKTEQLNDKMEETKLQENLDWAEQEEQRELEELQRKQEKEQQKTSPPQPPATPVEDPENKKWMEEILRKELEQGKKLYGEDFGEDLSIGE